MEPQTPDTMDPRLRGDDMEARANQFYVTASGLQLGKGRSIHVDMRDVADRLEVNELMARYCHALDQKDWPAFHAVFTDDAILDFTAFGGPKGTAGALQNFLVPVLDSLIGSQHMVSTVIVDIDGDRAKARSAAIVPMTARAADGSEQTSLSGLWYEDQLVRTPGGWRICHRRQVRGWAISPQG